jgi:UDP-N-acetyl-D-mannosaminuronic acid transferase (WecB/TagA/CpsF family)
MPTPSKQGRIQFLGLGFDPMGANQAARAIARRARQREAFAYVATPNIDHLVRLDRSPGLRRLYQDAWLTLCDSRVLEIFAWVSDVKLPLACGEEIVEQLFREHVRADDTVLVVGGDAGLVRALRERHAIADLRSYSPSIDLKDDAAIRSECAAFIRANPASFIFLAAGSPLQEMIAHEVLASGDAVGVAVCCGGALDALARKSVPARQWLARLAPGAVRLCRRLVDGPRLLGIWRRWLAGTRPASTA